MMEQVAKNIYRIGVTLPNNPLKELNSYFIRGDESDLLIDTGFRNPVCRQALEEGLAELGSDPARRDVLLTHLHSDHSGMADLFVGPGRRIYMGKDDLTFMMTLMRGGAQALRGKRYIEEGFPRELVEYIEGINPASNESMEDPGDIFYGLADGEVLPVGEYRLQTVFGPGPTPGNTMFWAAEQKIMFSGDHILFDITPNITSWPNEEDALGRYIESLEKAKSFPVRQTLPGHRKTGDYHGRIDALLAHHRARLDEALGIVRRSPGLTAYEITSRMTWRIHARSWEEFPPTQKWFAVGECLSHLDHLREKGMIHRQMVDGTWRYEAV